MSAATKPAVPHAADDEDVDIRAAARREARREGVPLGEWLDGIMAGRAAELGLTLADLDPNQRIEAVMLRLGRAHLGGQPQSAASFKPRTGEDDDSDENALGSPTNQDAPQDLRRDGMTAAALTRESFEEQVPENGMGAGTRAWERPRIEDDTPSGAEQAATAASRQARQRGEIENKLNALFKTLDRTPRRADHAVVADPEAISEQRMDALLGQTAISPSWRLDKAVGEIAERQAALDRQAAAEGVPPATPRGAPRAAAEDVRRQYDKSRSEGAAARHAAASVPSVFTALQGDIARLAKRLDAVHQDVSRREPLRQETSFDEIRSLLDTMRPDASINSLGRSVEALSAKLDQMNETRVAPDAFHKLAQRIEDVHTEVSARLSSQPVAPVVDMVAIEQMIRDLVQRADRPTQAAPDMRGLEDAVQDLADKLDRAERSTGSAELLAELQLQVGTLAKRIDKSDAGLVAIVAMERSLGEIFAQMGEMREAAVQAAESTAQVAAQETLRAAIAETRLGHRVAAETNDAAVEQVSQELADMRAGRQEADQRLHAILAALNTSLERVVDRLASLEDDVAQNRLRPNDPVPAASPSAPVLGVKDDIQPIARPGSRVAEPLDLDVPIEPRTIGRHRKAPVVEPRAEIASPTVPTGPVPPDPTSFIAAARRAAQAATTEATQAEIAAETRRRTSGLAADPDGTKRLKTGMLSRRRPWLLALASFVVLAGAAEVVRLGLNSSEPGVSLPAGDVTGTTPPRAAVTSQAPDQSDAAVPDVKPQSALPDVAPEKSVAAQAADPVKTPDASPAPVAPTSPAAPATVVASLSNTDPLAPAAGKTLPTMAMGPAANMAAVQAADLAARAAAAGGISPALRAQADSGNAAAQFEVGLRYADGRGVARDPKVAATYFEKAAKQGLAPAAYRLGSLYEKGLGVARDAPLSISWYQKAADAGNVRAMHNLAVMLAEGAAGKADYTTAASWFTKAAEAGVRDSQYNLAILFARGMGVEQSLAHSYTWFAIAAANGDADSAKKRDEVATRLDATTLAAAKKAADDFKPAPQLAAANDVAPPAGGWDVGQSLKPVSPAASPKAPTGGKVSRL